MSAVRYQPDPVRVRRHPRRPAPSAVRIDVPQAVAAVLGGLVFALLLCLLVSGAGTWWQ